MVQNLSGGEGWLAPALVLLSVSKRQRAGGKPGVPGGAPPLGWKSPFLT
jgi:hypothetical protein